MSAHRRLLHGSATNKPSHHVSPFRVVDERTRQQLFLKLLVVCRLKHQHYLRRADSSGPHRKAASVLLCLSHNINIPKQYFVRRGGGGSEWITHMARASLPVFFCYGFVILHRVPVDMDTKRVDWRCARKYEPKQKLGHNTRRV